MSNIGSGWQNQRIISLVTSLIALLITAIGAWLTTRSLRKEEETMKLRGAYSVRAVVRMSNIGSGWQNQRIISLVTSLIALLITAIGAWLTTRSLRKEEETM